VQKNHDARNHRNQETIMTNVYVASSRTSAAGTPWLFLGIDGVTAAPGTDVTLYRCKADTLMPKGTRITNVVLIPTDLPAETLPKRIGDEHATIIQTVTMQLSADSEAIEPYEIPAVQLAGIRTRRATAPYARTEDAPASLDV